MFVYENHDTDWIHSENAANLAVVFLFFCFVFISLSLCNILFGVFVLLVLYVGIQLVGWLVARASAVLSKSNETELDYKAG